MTSMNRRQFLSLGAKTLTGAGLALGSNPYWTLAHAANDPGAGNDYRAVVCLFLQGGCDGISLMVPTDSAAYNEYARSRGGLAVSKADLLGIKPQTTNASSVGLHPSAAPLQRLFEEQKLAMISNVGNLIHPTSVEQYKNKAVDLPAQLFSHADQEMQWQQLQGRGRGTEGWGARAAGFLAARQDRQHLTSITLDGSNHWQTGFASRPFSMSETGVLQYAGMSSGEPWEQARVNAFTQAQALPQQHEFIKEYASIQQRAMQVTTELGSVLAQNEGISASPQEGSSLEQRLGMVANLIAAREQLGMRRQIFFVNMRGFDVHDNQNKVLPELFSELSAGMEFFQSALENIGQSENVTTFAASDFGRSLSGNGDGTDHGWGNHLMVMGGAVNGGDIYGTLPRLSVDGPDSVSNGRVLPTISSAQYAGTLLNWMGLDDSQLDQTLPTLGNFQTRDLGFMRNS